MAMYSCQKEEGPPIGEMDPIAEARQVFESKNKTSLMTYTGRSFLPDHLLPNRDIDWHSAFSQQRGDTVSVFVPIRFPVSIRLRSEGLQDTRLNDLILLRMTKPGDNGQFTTEMLTLIPDQPWLEGTPFSGNIIVEDWFRPISNYYSSHPANETKPVLASSLPQHVGDVQASASGCTSYMICVGEVEMISMAPQRNIVMNTHPTPQASSNQSGEICYTNNYCPSGVSDGFGDIPYNPPPLGGGSGGNAGGSGSGSGHVNVNLKRYILSPEIRDKYKKFAALVDGIEDFLRANPEVLDALAEFTGFSKEKILEIARDGYGPEIKLDNDPRNALFNGIYLRSGEPNTIYINENNVRTWEGHQSRLLPPQHQYDGLAFSIMVTILHETVHYGRFHNGLPDPRGHPDQGTAFEKAAFKFEIDYQYNQPVQYRLYYKWAP